jgi:endonuclease/exonuclease/phosphatase family metal-dependent hydrolase/SAM-dependent methyltransferase
MNMNRVLSSLLILLLWAPGSQAEPDPLLRVLTYNIHHGEGTDGSIDLPRVAAVIKSANADLVALQEIDQATERSGGVKQLDELARLTGMHAQFGKAMDYMGGAYGVGVLSRWPIEHSHNQPLSTSPDREARTALTVQLRAGPRGPLLQFTSTHLDQGREEQNRLAQAAGLNAIGHGEVVPALLAGDLNARLDTEVMTLVGAEWTNASLVNQPPVGPDGRPRLRGDYVLYKPAAAWRVIDSIVLDDRIASDHRPVLAVVELASPQAAAQQLSPEQKIYEAFRAWMGQQPAAVQNADDVLERYKAKLLKDGVSAADADGQVRVINEQADRLEVERWNQILTAPKPAFNTQPNAFLVRMVQGRKPGRALDVGMGQGRNAIFLASQGWNVTGFDPADRAVAAANQAAQARGLKLTTLIVGSEKFDFGRNQWDLIVLSYVSLRQELQKIIHSLAPGGMVVVEGFHRDTTLKRPVGGGVVFDTNELLKLFAPLRVVQYEDLEGPTDFGIGEPNRLVRLAAVKP